MLISLSVDHRRTSVAEREPLTIPVEEAHRLMALIGRSCGGQTVLLITCARIEVYTWVPADNPVGAMARMRAVLHRVAPALAERFLSLARVRIGPPAARHLFRVAAGLESPVPGDHQVLVQVRTAYAQAVSAASVGPELHRLFQTALHTGRRVHLELADGARRMGQGTADLPSVGAAAAEEIVRRLGSLAGCPVTVIGAGSAARAAVERLVGLGAAVTIANRTRARAESLAREFGCGLVELDARYRAIDESAAVLVATGAPEPTVVAGALSELPRRSTSLLLVDLGAPRNVDPAVAALPGVTLLGLEDLTTAAPHHPGAADRIVARELDRLSGWFADRRDRARTAA